MLRNLFIGLFGLFFLGQAILAQENNSDSIKINLSANQSLWKIGDDIRLNISIESFTNEEIIFNKVRTRFLIVSEKTSEQNSLDSTFLSPVVLQYLGTSTTWEEVDGKWIPDFETTILRLSKKEKRNYKIQLKYLKWDLIESNNYPKKDLFDLAKNGNYKLVFWIECENCNSIKSNEISFSVR